MQNDPETVRYLRGIREKHIDPLTSHPYYQTFLAYLERYETEQHYPRFAQTMCGILNALGDHILEHRDIRICETGDLSLVSQFLREEGFDIRGTSTDLRYSIDADDDSIDLMLSLEVFEHIKDQREQNFDDIVLFYGTGARRYAEEAFRALRPGGYLVLTTPNPSSVRMIRQLVDYEPPMIFRGHVREYTRKELEEFFAAFEIVEYRTFFSYWYLDAGPSMSRELAQKIGWDPEHRGDCHFFVFRKPSADEHDDSHPGAAVAAEQDSSRVTTADATTRVSNLDDVRALLREGALQRALEGWNELHARFAYEPGVWLEISQAFAAAGDAGQAEEILGHGVGRYPGDLWLAYHHAHLAAARGDGPEALGRWSALHGRFPDSPLGFVGLGGALCDAGRLDEAEALLTPAVGRFTQDFWLNYQHARVAIERGERRQGVTRSWRLVATFPDQPAGYLLLSRALEQAGRAVLVSGAAQFPADPWIASRCAELGIDPATESGWNPADDFGDGAATRKEGSPQLFGFE